MVPGLVAPGVRQRCGLRSASEKVTPIFPQADVSVVLAANLSRGDFQCQRYFSGSFYDNQPWNNGGPELASHIGDVDYRFSCLKLQNNAFIWL